MTVPVPLAAGIAGAIADAVAGLGAAADAVRVRGAWAGVLLVVLGAAALTVPARSRRALAVVGGFALGGLAALAARGWISAHVGISPWISAAVAAVAGAAIGGGWPRAFPFVAGAVPGAVIGSGVPLAGRALLGAAAGAAVGGVVGLAAGRAAVTVALSLVGGALVAVGGVALLGARPFAEQLAARPFALAALAVVLGVAGAAYQLSRRREERGAPRAERPLEPP